MEQSGILGRAYSSSYPQIYIKKENIIIYIYTLFSVCHFVTYHFGFGLIFKKKHQNMNSCIESVFFVTKNQNERINQC